MNNIVKRYKNFQLKIAQNKYSKLEKQNKEDKEKVGAEYLELRNLAYQDKTQENGKKTSDGLFRKKMYENSIENNNLEMQRLNSRIKALEARLGGVA